MWFFFLFKCVFTRCCFTQTHDLSLSAASGPQHHDQKGVHQHSRALAPAQREHSLRRAKETHPHTPAREEAEQERDPAAGHALHQLSGDSAGQAGWRTVGSVASRSSLSAGGEHAEPAHGTQLDQRHRPAITRVQRQLWSVVMKLNWGLLDYWWIVTFNGRKLKCHIMEM